MPTPDNGIPEWDRARLEQGLRACDSRALVAFYSHFRPILRERAQLFGIPHEDRADAIETFLGDMLLKLCSISDLPRSLHAYVFVSFKRYAIRLRSANAIRNQSIEDLKPEASPAVTENSEPYQSVNQSLARFSAVLLADLSSDELLILGAASEEMPLREIAALLGVNYNAANTRLCRLRSRLREAAPGIVSRMSDRDRQIVGRFLRRATPGSHSGSARRVAERLQGGEQRRSDNG